MTTLGLGLALLAMVVLGIGPAGAAEKTFTAKLDGAHEVPNVDSKGTGEATFKVSDDGKKIEYTLTVQDMTDVTMAHIHIAAEGKNGPVVVWLYPRGGKPKLIKGPKSGELAKGEITGKNLAGPLKGKPLADLVKDLEKGDAYVNVHTQAHKGGEIRGQVAM